MLYPDVARGRVRTLVNPMASKISQGGQEYQDQENWDYWTQTNWQKGVGQMKPHRESNGYMLGQVDSRVPETLMLMPLRHQSDTRLLNNTTADCRYRPENVTSTIEQDTSLVVAAKFTTPGSLLAELRFWVYCRLYPSLSGTIQIYTDSSNAPGSLVSGKTDVLGPTSDNLPDWHWYEGVFTSAGLSTGTAYWLVVTLSSGGGVAFGDSGYDRVAMQYSGSWSNLTSKYLLYISDLHAPTSTEGGHGLFRFDGDLYLFVGAAIYKYSSSNNNWTSVGSAGTGNITSVAIPPGSSIVYLGKGSGNYYTLNTSDAIADGGIAGKLFLLWGGLLWRTDDNDLYYSDDGTNWNGPITLGSDAFDIRGIAGLGDYLYATTDEGMYRIDGESVYGVTRWGSPSVNNGKSLFNHDGKLYFILQNRVVEFTEAHTLRDIWVPLRSDRHRRLSTVLSLASTNNWLIAHAGYTGDGLPRQNQLYVYQNDGWHPVMDLPEIIESTYLPLVENYSNNHSIFFDPDTQRLWHTTPYGVAHYIYMPDHARSPVSDSNSRYEPMGFVVWDNFYGAVRELNKDIESVSISGFAFTSGRTARVYWYDEAAATWRLLGTIDSNEETLRFNNYTTRPRVKRFQMALLLTTNLGAAPPQIEAIVLRYQTHLKDRWRWNFTIITYDNQIGFNNEPMALTTRAAQDAVLEQLMGVDTSDEQTAPFILTDTTGSQYETKVVSASHQMDDVELVVADNSTKVYASIHTVVIEQAVAGTYSP
jgi:hypothetical protein